MHFDQDASRVPMPAHRSCLEIGVLSADPPEPLSFSMQPTWNLNSLHTFVDTHFHHHYFSSWRILISVHYNSLYLSDDKNMVALNNELQMTRFQIQEALGKLQWVGTLLSQLPCSRRDRDFMSSAQPMNPRRTALRTTLCMLPPRNDARPGTFEEPRGP